MRYYIARGLEVAAVPPIVLAHLLMGKETDTLTGVALIPAAIGALLMFAAEKVEWRGR